MSGLKRIKQQATTLNPLKLIKGNLKAVKDLPKQVKKDVKGTENYFKKPKFPEQIPAEMADEEMVSRANNRDMIRRRRSGGRSSTIMSDTLG